MKTLKTEFAKLEVKSLSDQMGKIREEFLEFETATGYQDRIEEAFDLLQATVTYINLAVSATGSNIKKYNKKHLAKMKHYADIKRVCLAR